MATKRSRTATARAHTPPAPADGAVLQHLLPLDRFAAANTHLFPSPHSFAWFVRQNRQALIKAGALCMVGGRKMIDPSRIGEVIHAAGVKAAATATRTQEAA